MNTPLNGLRPIPCLARWNRAVQWPRLPLALALIGLCCTAAGTAKISADPATAKSQGSDKIDVSSTDARIAPPYSVINDHSNPNELLYRYLGDPVVPPAGLDPAYSPQGLSNAIVLAGKNAGIKVKVLFVDESEFPFLLVISFANGDWERLKAQLQKTNGYAYRGSVSSANWGIFNITPLRVIPAEVRSAAARRYPLRESVLFDELTPNHQE
jgi:hypothetical protein